MMKFQITYWNGFTRTIEGDNWSNACARNKIEPKRVRIKLVKRIWPGKDKCEVVVNSQIDVRGIEAIHLNIAPDPGYATAFIHMANTDLPVMLTGLSPEKVEFLQAAQRQLMGCGRYD